MRFLYSKELAGEKDAYERRGYSSDTSPEASLPVWVALDVQRRLTPGRRVRRVLILGPGLDWAPRTSFDDRLPPRSYQPPLIREILLELGLARADDLELICADVNPLVVDRVSRPFFAGQLPRMALGAEHQPFEKIAARAFRPARPVHFPAYILNILTGRLEAEPFDLIVATNVLTYFSRRDLALALTNIQSMLAPGGWLVHIETRPEVEAIAALAGMTAQHARTIQVARGKRGPLMDAYILLVARTREP
jgi:hypothetical protein